MALTSYHLWHWQRDQRRLQDMRDAGPPPPATTWLSMPLVTVLVAAWNERDGIEHFLEHFEALRYPYKELVLCAGGDDDTFAYAFARRSATVQVIEQNAGEGKQRALARSLRVCRGEIVFLTDADCLLDDTAFERTIFPVVQGENEVSTGSSCPTEGAWVNPFVATQAASQLYPTLYTSEKATGILGRNCAIRRSTLERSQAMEKPAPTGTDYVLGQQLRCYGIDIRHVSDSRVVTRYPLTVHHYLRQQRRWLRNLVLHGQRFRVQRDVKASLRTSFTGLVLMVGMGIAVVHSGWQGTFWKVLFLHMLLARLRYLNATARLLQRRLTWRHLLFQPFMIVIDLVAWTLPLADYATRHRRWEW